MCAVVVDELTLSCTQNVASSAADCGVVQHRYSKLGRSCLKYVIVDVFSDGREEFAEQEAGEVCWYPFVPSAAERAAFHRLVAAGGADNPWPLIIPIEDEGHIPERGCSREWLMEVVEFARRGNPKAKRALMSILATERNRIIIWRLINRGVNFQDIGDVHHDVVVRVGERIEQLRCKWAYFKWEAQVVNDVANGHVRACRATARLIGDTAFEDLETGNRIEGGFS